MQDGVEACDLGKDNGPGQECLAGCALNVCGDGDQSPSEACDDGDTEPGDGCNAACELEACGNGVLDAGEACDDGDADNDDDCTTLCKLPICGDGFTQAGEACDLGPDNKDTGDCTLGCKLPTCGDGLKQGVDYYNQEKGKKVKVVGWNGKTGTFTGGFEANEVATNTADAELYKSAVPLLFRGDIASLDGLRGYVTGLALRDAVRSGTSAGAITTNLRTPRVFTNALLAPWSPREPGAGSPSAVALQPQFLSPTLVPPSAGGEAKDTEYFPQGGWTVTSRAPPDPGLTVTLASMMRSGPMTALNLVGVLAVLNCSASTP